MKIAILTRPDYRSPRILAQSLKLQIEKTGNEATIFFEINFLTKLGSFKESNLNFLSWLKQKVNYYQKIKSLIHQLKKFDAIVISECTPNAFWKNLYKIEALKHIIKKPVLLYEVYYLGNAPTQIKKLNENGDTSFERYSWHLSVTDATEIRTNSKDKWSCIGIDLTTTGLAPIPKQDFFVLIDFPQPGYEFYRNQQIKVLQENNIKTIILEGSYTPEDIRKLYQKAAIFLMQTSESFGMPLAESLACGTQIFAADSSWPMSWRLDQHPEIHGPGLLPNCFTIYNGEEDFKNKLLDFKKNYNLEQTPKIIFNSFINSYPHLYYGNSAEVKRVFDLIGKGTLVD
jgi:hypothetical protein